MATQTNNLQKYRKKKKRKLRVKRFLIFLMIVLFGCLAFVTRDKWVPFFDGIISRYKTIIVNDGHLAKGNFPIAVGKSVDFDIEKMNKGFVLLTDSYIRIYDEHGENNVSKQHGMANPVIKAKNKRVLLYDIGGYTFTNENKLKTIYTKTTQDQILLGRLSEKEYTAIVTKSDKYTSLMTIYNKNGNEIFYSSSSDRIIDIAFDKSSTGCIATTIGAKGGQLVSTLLKFKFDKTEKQWSSEPIKTMVLTSSICEDGSIVAVGDTLYASFSSAGKLISSYKYTSDLVDYSTNGDITALISEHTENEKSNLTIISIGKKPVEIVVDKTAKSVKVDDKIVYVLCDDELYTYDDEGVLLARADLAIEYVDFAVNDDYVYLLGYDDINRIDFKT